jgi:hypothetical protein
MELNVSHLHDEMALIFAFSDRDAGIIEMDMVFQVDAVPSHS